MDSATRGALLLVVTLTGVPSYLPAQDLGLAGLFKEIDGVVIYAHASTLARPGPLRTRDGLLHDPWGLRSAGFELLVALDTARWDFEFALGYEHMAGFANRAGAAFDLY